MQNRLPDGDVLDWPVDFIADLTARSVADVESAIEVARAKRRLGCRSVPAPRDRAGLLAWAGFAEANSQVDGDFPADEAEWRIERDYPLAPFTGLVDGGRDGWVEWFREECAMQVEEGRDGYLELLLEEIETTVTVVELSGERVDVWDGWHRIGASIVRGSAAIPALVGDRRIPYEPEAPSMRP
jgi:hypothetical protein